ncbi:MAG: hypothetical protein IID40_10420, partial [Planctomycetes bacterium]|nr:hypothetical protein [Planctomycetota bacterium]
MLVRLCGRRALGLAGLGLALGLALGSGFGCMAAAGSGGGNGDDDAMPEMRTLQVAFEGLESLGDSFVYEGWIIVDDNPVSTGRFAVLADGTANPATFEIDADDAAAATVFILTIEPSVGDDPAPADTHVLAGALEDGSATLTVGHAAALGDDFTSAEGTFILETPSTADLADDFAQGIWWLDPDAGPGPSLVLPELPAGWVYEGWVVGVDGPMSTGRF